MDSKLVWVLVGLAAFYLFFIRKNTALVVGATSSANVLNKGITPTAAIPQPSTTQIITAAAVKNAPQILSALGSFFNSDNDVDTSSDDSLDDILG